MAPRDIAETISAAGVVADGADAVKGVYRNLAETQTCVMLVENEHLWGVDDPSGYYREVQHFVMVWPYDKRARLIGEHVYEDKPLHRIEQIEREDFISLGDARECLLPLLRPLPELASTATP
jgi:hypothetical protein